MSAPKFTPGPWVLTQETRWPWSYSINSGDVQVLHYGLYTYASDDDQQRANARGGNTECHANVRLIAAAPELYEAAIGAGAALAAAISLLEGGGKKAAPSDRMFDQMLLDYNAALDRARAALAKARGEA